MFKKFLPALLLVPMLALAQVTTYTTMYPPVGGVYRQQTITLNGNGNSYNPTLGSQSVPDSDVTTLMQFGWSMDNPETRIPLLFNDAGTALGTSPITTYCSLSGAKACNATVAQSYQQASFSGSLKNLTLTFSAAPGSSGSFTATLYVGGSTTALTCNITNSASVVTCSDPTHSVAVTAGASIALQVVLAGTIANSASFFGGIELDTP